MTEALNGADQNMADGFCTVLAGPGAKMSWRTIPKQGAPRKIEAVIADAWEQVEAANRRGDGVFIVVNETDGKGQSTANVTQVRAVFVDLDGAPLDSVLEAEIEPHMVIESSPEKYHAYWLVRDCPLGHFRDIQKAIAQRFGGDPSVCDLPRVMRVPGFYHTKGEPVLTRILSRTDTLPYSLDEIVAGLELEPLLNGPQPPSQPQRRRVDPTRPLGDGERTEALTKLCGGWIRQGLDDATIMGMLQGWNAQHNPPLPDDKLIDTLASIRSCDNRNNAANDSVVGEFNREHAVVKLGGKTVVLCESPGELEYMSFHSFREFYSNLPPVDGAAATNYWLKHPDRRTYRTVVFTPGGEAANDEYNLWRGFAVEPRDGDCSLYLAHIRDNIAAGDARLYKYLLDWMADAVQNPRQLPGVAIALRGRQGTGKGMFIDQFGQLFGPHFKQVHAMGHLTGQFTRHLADAQLVFADEAVWGGDKQGEGPLKTLITERRRLVEGKGKDAFMVDNYVRLMMATNEGWAVPAGAEERRFCVIDVGNGRMQDSDYFGAITRQMDNGGREALFHILLARDISGVNIRDFPRTNALLEQKENSLESVPLWWWGCLQDSAIGPHNEWPEWLDTTSLYGAYTHATEGERYRRGRAGSKQAFARALGKCAPVTRERRSSTIPGREGVRPYGYAIPPLDECRAAFARDMGQQIEWED